MGYFTILRFVIGEKKLNFSVGMVFSFLLNVAKMFTGLVDCIIKQFPF